MKKPHEQQWKWDAMSEMVVDEHGRVVSTPANLYDEEVQAIGWLTSASPDMARAGLALHERATEAARSLPSTPTADALVGMDTSIPVPSSILRAMFEALRKGRVLP